MEPFGASAIWSMRLLLLDEQEAGRVFGSGVVSW